MTSEPGLCYTFGQRRGFPRRASIRQAAGIASGTEAGLGSAKDPVDVLVTAVASADESVKQTPELLPVLKQAGVVDSGGKGLFFVLEGMLRHVYGESLETPTMSVQPISSMQMPCSKAMRCATGVTGGVTIGATGRPWGISFG